MQHMPSVNTLNLSKTKSMLKHFSIDYELASI